VAIADQKILAGARSYGDGGAAFLFDVSHLFFANPIFADDFETGDTQNWSAQR
jgi:hypothetical protein